MESRADCDLNQCITSWRDQLGRWPGIRAEDIRELEAHLRDSLEESSAGGLSPAAAWQRANEKLGTPQALASEFGKRNRGMRLARSMTCLVVSIVVGSVLLRGSSLVAAESWWPAFGGWYGWWAGFVFVATVLFVPACVLGLGVCAQTRNMTGNPSSTLFAAVVGASFGSLFVLAWAFTWSEDRIELNPLTVVAASLAGASGPALHASLRATRSCESLIRGIWAALAGSWVCGAVYVGCMSLWFDADFRWLRLLSEPFGYCLLWAWIACPAGAIVAVVLDLWRTRLGALSSLIIGSTVGALSAGGMLAAWDRTGGVNQVGDFNYSVMILTAALWLGGWALCFWWRGGGKARRRQKDNALNMNVPGIE